MLDRVSVDGVTFGFALTLLITIYKKSCFKYIILFIGLTVDMKVQVDEVSTSAYESNSKKRKIREIVKILKRKNTTVNFESDQKHLTSAPIVCNKQSFFTSQKRSWMTVF